MGAKPHWNLGLGYNRDLIMRDSWNRDFPAFFRFIAISTITTAFTFALIAMPDGAAAQKAPKHSAKKQQVEDDELPPTPEDLQERKGRAALVALTNLMRAKARADVDAAVKSVAVPDAEALAKALGIDKISNPAPEDPAISVLEDVDDLDGDGIHEQVFRWPRRERFKVQRKADMGPLPGWVLFLMSWDGHRWRASELMTGDGVYSAYLLPRLWDAYALAIVEGLGTLPYPVIFRFQDHTATLAWDSRSDESRYQSYANGIVRFDDHKQDAPPTMAVMGRADPGVIRFSSEGKRGFDVATLYQWEGGAYVPKKTEFAENEDHTLYRFIAALHLHDFRAAYSLVDQSQFLGGEGKTLEAFKKYVEDNLPEFLENSIFDAAEPDSNGGDKFRFELSRGDVRYVYSPAFSGDGKFLLTRLEKREEK